MAWHSHRQALERRLGARGIDVGLARSQDHYIDLDADTMLSTFMSNGWPDDDLFKQAVTR